MAQVTVDKPTASAVVFPLNHKSWSEAKASIQNNTSAALTVQVTNQNIQETTSPVFADPPSGPLSIAVGDVGLLDGPFEAANFDGLGTGTIDVVQSQ